MNDREPPVLAASESDGAPVHGKYFFKQDDEEAQRLNKQHILLRDLYGGQLLPEGYVPRDGDRILDSGTGTGIWVLDLASTLAPSIHVTGIDIRDTLFPHSPPANTEFLLQSILALPTSWSSTFACIHQRLLTMALGVDEWKCVLGEMLRVLKPGGWIRLEEISHNWTPALDAARTPSVYRYNGLVEEMCRLKGVLLAGPSEAGRRNHGMIEKILEEAGFTEVKKKTRILGLGPGEKFTPARDDFISVWRQMSQYVMNVHGMTQEEADDMANKLKEETYANDIGMEWYEWTARKPQGPFPYTCFLYTLQQTDSISMLLSGSLPELTISGDTPARVRLC